MVNEVYRFNEIYKFNEIYRGKTVLVTGHTGFKGSWLSIWLLQLGANVVGYSMEPRTNEDNFSVSGLADKMDHHIGDIRDIDHLNQVYESSCPEFVFHLAAQPIVRESYKSPKETFDVNVSGTVNLLECARSAPSVKVFINITSDKCYENKEWHWGYRENDALGGHDPYSASKGCSELVTNAYYKSFFKTSMNTPKYLSSVRAGNVIGGGDWQIDRLVPDCIRKLEKNEPVEIRNPKSIRPWQHVLEPLSGYLLLGQKMIEEGHPFCGAWNFGPSHTSIVPVNQVVEQIIREWGGGDCDYSGNPNQPHEASLLTLDISKSNHLLNWKPKWDLQQSIQKTVEWYKNARKNNAYIFNCRQIDQYISEG